jgi:hypothetical protein
MGFSSTADLDNRLSPSAELEHRRSTAECKHLLSRDRFHATRVLGSEWWWLVPRPQEVPCCTEAFTTDVEKRWTGLGPISSSAL